jgi:F-type H+-transporting ATPase subunit c
MKRFINLLSLSLISSFYAVSSAFAEPTAAANENSGLIAIGAGIAIGVAACGGALGQGRAIGSALDSIGRNPSASGQLFTPMLLGLVFIETLVIFSFVIAFFLLGKFQ